VKVVTALLHSSDNQKAQVWLYHIMKKEKIRADSLVRALVRGKKGKFSKTNTEAFIFTVSTNVASSPYYYI